MARGTIIPKELANGEKRYVAVIRLNGKQVWKTFKKRTNADNYLNRNSTDAAEGTYREIKKGTFEKYVEVWKDKNLIPQELKPSTLSGYAYVINKHMIPYFGAMEVSKITTAEITDFRSTKLKEGQSAKSVKNLLDLLNRIFSDAIEDGYAKHTPMPQRRRKADKVTKSDRKGRALQPAEVQRLLDQCEADPQTKRKANPELRLVILLGLLAGLRRGEIFGLQWQDIDWTADVIHVRHNLYYRHGKHHNLAEDESAFVIDSPKSETSIRDVDFSPALKKELRERFLKSEDKHGLIFQSSNGTPLDPHNVYERWFKPAVDRAVEKAEKDKDKAAAQNLKGVRLHDLRHSFGSWKIAQGEDVVYVSRQLGHANVSITVNVYTHLIKARRPSAAALTDSLLFGSEKAAASE